MNEKRIAHLSEMLKATPDDPFLLYAMGLEYLNGQDFDTAAERFGELVDSHPDYVPTYYQYALALVNKGEVDKAMEILPKGIEVATQANERKTANELAMLLEDLED